MKVANDGFFDDFEDANTNTITAYMTETLDLDVTGHKIMSLDEAVDAVFDRIRGAMCSTPFFLAAMDDGQWDANTRRAIKDRLLSDSAEYDNEGEFYALELGYDVFVAVPNSYMDAPTW